RCAQCHRPPEPVLERSEVWNTDELAAAAQASPALLVTPLIGVRFGVAPGRFNKGTDRTATSAAIARASRAAHSWEALGWMSLPRPVCSGRHRNRLWPQG